uniref:Putative alpha toxin Tx452 n=1 Tax=Buthus israelis TaxID=2899555 RepID=B8XGY8_BUTIS|nr:putative alpha toxin Tx452 [Buthus occitanus israelis]
MNYLVMISLALLLMTGVESVHDGYISQPENCVYHCFPGSSGCDTLCKEKGAKSGMCGYKFSFGTGCWCEGLPDKVRVKIEGKKCTR